MTVSSLRSLFLSLSLLLFLFTTVSSFSCYDNLLGHLTLCNDSSFYSHCQVYIQGGGLHQDCGDSNFFNFASCKGKLEVDYTVQISYRYCCTTHLCNSEQVLYDEIAKYSASLMTPSQTILSQTTPSQTLPSQTSPLQTSPSQTSPSQVSPSQTISSQTSPSQPILTTTLFISSTPSPLSSSSDVTSTTNVQATIIVVNPTDDVSSTSVQLPSYIIVLVTILVVAIILFITALAIVLFIYFHPRHVVGIAVPTESEGTPTISTGSYEFSSNQDLFDDGTTSGSGAGLPLLVQRSVAAQVTPSELVGKGRFGEVWRGSYKGDSVAVKIFHSKEETSWAHEVDIYQTCLIRHPNILRFIAADNKDIGIATQLWLITEYCDLGSLYELLLNEVLDESTVLKLSYTAACGLAHLHAEITGIEGKPAIAHRDIKSRNILVKADYTCCIADLGLALRYDKATDTVEEPPTKRVGTRRYLSPEILDDSLNVKNFDFFKRSDMYSFGLVLWEMTRRGLCGGHAEDYQLPYFDSVTPDPSFEEMQRVVAVERKRPSFPNRWSQSVVFDSISDIISQCWHHNGEARLTALRVKKRIHTVQMEHVQTKDRSSSTTNQLQVSL